MLQKTVDRQVDDIAAERRLMCVAHGCPNRWSVDIGTGGAMCSAHAWADRKNWPSITDEQLRRIAARQDVPQKKPPVPMTDAQKRATLLALRQVITSQPSDPKAWAHRLKARHDAGEKLTQQQVRCYRSALRLSEGGEA